MPVGSGAGERGAVADAVDVDHPLAGVGEDPNRDRVPRRPNLRNQVPQSEMRLPKDASNETSESYPHLSVIPDEPPDLRPIGGAYAGLLLDATRACRPYRFCENDSRNRFRMFSDAGLRAAQ